MYWVAEYHDGKVITEEDLNFSKIPKNNIRLFYFYDGDIPIGFEGDTGLFFIGDKKYDFKTGNGRIEPLQFKRATTMWSIKGDTENKILSFNIGYSKSSSKSLFKYLLSINSEDRSVYLKATKESLNGIVLDSKQIRLK